MYYLYVRWYLPWYLILPFDLELFTPVIIIVPRSASYLRPFIQMGLRYCGSGLISSNYHSQNTKTNRIWLVCCQHQPHAHGHGHKHWALADLGIPNGLNKLEVYMIETIHS